MAQKHFTLYAINATSFESSKTHVLNSEFLGKTSDYSAVTSVPWHCFYCGFKCHPHTQCPARHDICNSFQKGHYTRSKNLQTPHQLVTVVCLSKAMSTSTVIGELIDVLIDTESSKHYERYYEYLFSCCIKKKC